MDKCIISTSLSEIKEEDLAMPQSNHPHIDPSISFTSFIKSLYDLLSKRKYRKALTEIKKNEEEEEQAKSHPSTNPQTKKSISIIKLQCYFHIIKRKMTKYSNIASCNISSWLNRIETELDILSHCLLIINCDNSDLDLVLIEQFIYYYLLYLYDCALYSKRLKLYSDSIAYLAIADNTIKTLSAYIAYPSTLHLIQLIYLLLSGILIEQGYYSTSINYLTLVLTFGLKEIELRGPTNKESKVIVRDSNTTNTYANESIMPHYTNTFFDFFIAFLQLGICAESIGNYDLATDSYEQSKWFISLIASESISECLIDFINDLTIKSKQLLDLLSLLKITDFTSRDYTEVKVDKPPNVYFSDEERMKRYKPIEDYIETLKLTEIDDEEATLLEEVGKESSPTLRVKTMTSTVNFINLLMSNKYKPLVSSIDRLEINNLDKDTKKIIQKKIIDNKNTERIQLYEANRRYAHAKTYGNGFNSNPNMTNDSNRTKINMGFSAYPHLQTETTLPSTNQRNNIDSNVNDNALSSNTNTNTESNLKAHTHTTNTYTQSNTMSSLYSTRIPQKISYDKFVFNKSYRNKINYLESQSKKEYLFQKKLLKMKRYDTLPLKNQEAEKVRINCEKFYKTTLSNCMQKIKEKQDTSKITLKSIEQDIRRIITMKRNKKANDNSKRLNALMKRDFNINNNINSGVRLDLCPLSPQKSNKKTLESLKQNQKMIDQLEYDIEILGGKAQKTISHKNKAK